MLTRAGTMVRKPRRRYNGSIRGNSRRRSAPTVLQRSGNRKLLTRKEEKIARLSNVSEISHCNQRVRGSAEQSSQKSVTFSVDTNQLTKQVAERNGFVSTDAHLGRDRPYDLHANSRILLMKVSQYCIAMLPAL